MPPSPADNSERTLAQARAALARRQAGGRRSVGRGAAKLKAQHAARKLARIVAAVVAILVAAALAGLIVDGIGFTGLLTTVLAIVVAVAVLARYPRLAPPERADLATADTRSLVARTELWLDAQRPMLPGPAAELVGQIGVQLDELGVQLAAIDPAHPAAQEVRKLVGEHLPEMVESYGRIPPRLRQDSRNGATADQQLAEGLGKISLELDEVTRQLAGGDLDSLAVRGRYLDYRYGGGLHDRSNG